MPAASVTDVTGVTAPKAQAPELAAQLAQIDGARAALAAGDIQLALATLDRYDLDFLHGDLAPESLALRVEAYANRHDDVKVAELGEKFLSRYPSHPQARRVEAMMKAAGAR
jgi:outer membrane protein assembly factor BamD (BamD/ComL family)